MTAEGSTVFPTSFAQERLWIIERLAPGTAAYHVPVAVRLRGQLDQAALGAALSLIVGRHEVLRTVFDQIGGQTVQRVLAAEPVIVEVRDVPEGAEKLGGLLTAEAALGFSLDTGPLLRATLFRLSATDHVLAITVHHLVSDMWSVEVLLRELSVAYSAYRAGQDPVLPGLPVQYVDYAVWQRQEFSTARRDDLLAYWRTAMADAPAFLALPTDRPRPAVQSAAGAQQPVSLTPELSRDVRDLARRHGVTPFMTLLGAFGALLGRFTGAEDIVVGTAVGTRDTQTEPLIGCFINTVPLRLRLTGDPTFAELLGRVRDVTLGALEHQDLPFDKLVEDLAPRRDLSHNPLAQVLFLVQNAPEPTADLTGLRAEPISVERGGSQCDLSVHLREAGGRFEGFLEYSTDLFDGATMRRWWQHLETLLAAAAAAPDTRLSHLPCLTPSEISLVVEWNQTEAEFDEALLHEFVARQAETQPGAPALMWSDGQLSYAELNRRADEVAAVLRTSGVGPGTRVAVYGDRDPDLIAAILGTLKAGGAYVPLNTGNPRDRLALMLDDARPAVILAQRRHAPDLPSGFPALFMDDLPPAPQTLRPASVNPGDLAYVIYTSGSTGKPKGVMVEHRSVANLLAWLQRRYPIGPTDVLLQKTPTSFDVSVPELFWWAIAGARLALLPIGAEKDPRQLLAAIAQHRVTVVNFVPSMFGAFLDVLEDTPELIAETESLRFVFCAGEELSPALAARFGRIYRHVESPPLLANLYGPTETTVYVSYFDCPAGQQEPLTRVPIGRPSDNTGLYVLDAHDRIQPIGVPGELCIFGASAARGYLDRPGLTAERFAPHPYAGMFPGIPAGARMYRSGDLCRYAPDGAVEWLGRLDFQVKVRGFRIELGEITTALRAHPRVADAIVVVRTDEPDRPGRLVAYYVPTDGPEPTWSELRSFLRRTLPAHMVPEAFATLAALPLSPNGKTDPRALPMIASVRPALETGYLAPRNALEQVITDIWLGVLQLDQVGIEDDFFDLGGQSLLATQVASALRESLGLEIPLRAMFEAPNIAAQAELVGQFGRDADLDLAMVAGLVLQVRELTDEQVRERLAVSEG
jgi:amino acid adenylation domain-containing protein